MAFRRSDAYAALLGNERNYMQCERKISRDLSELWTKVPSPQFDASSLHELADRQSKGIKLAVRRQLLDYPYRPWEKSEASIAEVLFPNRQATSFLSKPHQWARFHEPQITGGLAFFINSKSAVTRLQRSRAFLKAVWPGVLESQLAGIVEAKATAEEGRIDLAVIGSDSEGCPVGAIIEAKFGHKVTARQLPKYRNLAIGKGLTQPHQRCLVVMAPESSKALRGYLRRNPEWTFLTWSQFLLSFDRHLDHFFDDVEFRAFRRTIWHRAYGL